MDTMSSPSTKPVSAGRAAFLASFAVDPEDSKLRWEPFTEEGRAMLLQWVMSPEFKELLDSSGVAAFGPEPDDSPFLDHQ
jgi:hypothetical protein